MAPDTDQLIHSLQKSVRPVRPLSCRWLRVAGWLALATPYMAMVVFAMSPRGDLAAKMSDWHFVIEQLAALATGLTAGLAAFASVVPGYCRKIIIAPMVPLAIWPATLGEGCVADCVRRCSEGLFMAPGTFVF